MKTPEEIAVEFSERFQNNYPKEPLWEMTVDLANEIHKLISNQLKSPERNFFGQWINYEKEPINKDGEYLLKCMNKYENCLFYDTAIYDEKYKELYVDSDLIEDSDPYEIIEYMPLPEL